MKTLIFISLFFICAAGGVFNPHLGVYGYLADYCIGPAFQWWEAPVQGLGIRYSLTLALSTIVGFVIQKDKLRFGEKTLHNREILILWFLAAVWFSYFVGDATTGRYSKVDHPTIKFTKVIVFLFLYTHIITDRKKFNGLLWVFTLSSMMLGIQAWSLPRRAFVGGRLEGVGGADFAESNFFAAFLAAMTPLIGVQFLKSKKLALKLVCLASGAFTVNAVVLCRSRGAFVGMSAGCLAALFFSPKEQKKKIVLGLVLGAMGGLYVMDEEYLARLTTIVVSEEEERDESANSRLLLWAAGLKMVSDKPLGIGIGNWYQTIEQYIPEYKGKDSHSTYVKCLAELGVQGFFIFTLLIFSAFRQIKWIKENAEGFPPELSAELRLTAFGLAVALVIYLTCALTITMIYIEITWIILMLPTCLRRVLENEMEDLKMSEKNE